MAEEKVKVGCRVKIASRSVFGTVAFVGITQFSPGKWVGIILDEPKGKNNGTVKGKRYFTCEENFGIFVRPSQLTLLDGPERSDVMKLSSSSVVSESGATSESKEVTKLAGSTSSLSVGLKTPETVKVPSEIEKTSQLPPTGSNPDLVRSSPAPTSTALKPETASAKIESPSSKPSADKPGASDIMSQSYTQISKSDSPTRKMISGSKLPTSTTTTTSTPPIPTGIKMPINPPEISQATAALSDVKAAAQKVDSENAPSELRDTSQKIPKTSVSAVPSGTGKYIPDTELELANLRAEVIEFREQIDALKAKREEDKNRIQELERVKIQLSQVEENRRRIRQQAAELQRESAQLKT
ncbi:unnamed protein product, partial [Trichobilharzia szidati]